MDGPHVDQLWAGRYRLVRRLGAGGMASVWLARDERLGRDVAVKVLSDVLAGDREYIERFEREARVAAKLNHAHLVTIFDFDVAGDRPYLVMELVSGGTVAARAAPDGLPPAEVERLAEEMLAALEHIHQAGVVHRDLKPANVLVDERGRFRLTDFGIAQPTDATSLTETGNLIGTIKYMAPEVRAGERATARSDLYSLRVLLRECGAGASARLAPLLEAIGEEDPAARPGSAAEAAALLRVATVQTRVMVRPRDRHSRTIIAALACGVLALVGIALAIGGGDEDEPAPLPGRGERDPARQAPAPAPEQEAPEEPAPPQQPKSESEPTAASCAELDERKRAIEEDKKAAEMAAGDDKEEKEAIKADFEAQKKAIEEQQKDCRP